MTSGISGPGGVGGPSGPGGADPLGGGEPLRGPSAATSAAEVDRIAAELTAGRITPDQAVAELVSQSTHALSEVERRELTALLGDLFATDPQLAAMARRLGVSVTE